MEIIILRYLIMVDVTENDLSQRIYIRVSEIQKIYGISRSTVYREVARGTFPKQVRLSKGCMGWSKHVLDKHFAQEADSSD